MHFGSALSSKSRIALPMLKLLILLATKTNSACFLSREDASQLKSSSVTIGTAIAVGDGDAGDATASPLYFMCHAASIIWAKIWLLFEKTLGQK